MKKYKFALLCAALLSAFACACASTPHQGAETGTSLAVSSAPKDIAQTYLQLLIDGKYDESDAMLSDEMKAAFESMGGSKSAIQSAIYTQTGVFKNIVALKDESTNEGIHTTIAHLMTDQGERLLRIATDSGGRIMGLFVLPPANMSEVARTYLQLIIDGRYDESDAMLSDEMKAALESMGGTKALFQALKAQLGAFKSIAAINDGPGQSLIAHIVTAQDEQRFKIDIDSAGRVAGFLLLPPQNDIEPPIAPPEGFVETPIAVDAGTGFPLQGRLVKPQSTQPAVPLIILVQGSGPHGFDETVGPNRVFGQLAFGLAKRGIATLRYDKRTHAYPAKMAALPNITVDDEYVQDVLAATALAKSLEGIGEVYILGHSQGGMLAPMFLAQGASAAGMILLAGVPRSLLDALIDQNADAYKAYVAAGQTDLAELSRANQDRWNQEAIALRAMSAEEAKQAGTVYTMPAYYLYTLEQYNAIDTIKELKKPIFILQGSADQQVYADKDYKMYVDALSGEPYAEFKLYDGLNHLFMPSSATNLVEALQEYNLKSSIPDEVFDDIAAWIGRRN
ncbi:MAG: alpha/beta fold hydrolase [Proteobacteria bacterium]|nr:alpha/beta fold hydrolase [Pseudomonadota bacterium]